MVRHFPAQISPGICYGQADIPSVACAADDVMRLQAQLPQNTTVYSSPSQRCISLAQKLFPRAPIFQAAQIMELNFGRWELTPWDLIARADLDNWAVNPITFAPPQGESFAALCERVQQFAQDKLAANSSAVLVTHAGVIKAFLYVYAGYALSAAVSHSAPFGSVTLVQLPHS